MNAEGELYHARYMWSESNYPRSMLDSLSHDQVVRLSPGMDKDTPVIKGAERRADIEALALHEPCRGKGLELRWVHSDAQLANSWTKPSEKDQAYLFVKPGQHWRVTYDESITSSRRRKQQGLSPMEQQFSQICSNECDMMTMIT